MNRIINFLLIILFLLNIYFSFIIDKSNIMRIGNWLLPYAIFAAYYFSAKKIRIYQRKLQSSNKRLKKIEKWCE